VAARAADDQVRGPLLAGVADAAPRAVRPLHDGADVQPGLRCDAAAALGDRLRRLFGRPLVLARGAGDEGVGQRDASERRLLRGDGRVVDVHDRRVCVRQQLRGRADRRGGIVRAVVRDQHLRPVRHRVPRP